MRTHRGASSFEACITSRFAPTVCAGKTLCAGCGYFWRAAISWSSHHSPKPRVPLWCLCAWDALSSPIWFTNVIHEVISLARPRRFAIIGVRGFPTQSPTLPGRRRKDSLGRPNHPPTVHQTPLRRTSEHTLQTKCPKLLLLDTRRENKELQARYWAGTDDTSNERQITRNGNGLVAH